MAAHAAPPIRTRMRLRKNDVVQVIAGLEESPR